jgi:hypothetical protein
VEWLIDVQQIHAGADLTTISNPRARVGPVLGCHEALMPRDHIWEGVMVLAKLQELGHEVVVPLLLSC